MRIRSLALSILLVLVGALLQASRAAAQTATYSGGSIYDLLPPMKQASGSAYLETLVLSKRLHRMKELREYSDQDVLRQLGRPIGRLSMQISAPDGSRKLGFCTVSLVAPGMILTNHHCLVRNPEGKVTDALLWMGLLTDEDEATVKRYGVELAPVEFDAALDYAIHKVRGDPGKEWGVINLGQTVKIYDRQSLFIIHHPAGDKQHITLGDCRSGAPGSKDDDLLHVCDTVGGSSGAPVFDNNTRLVVGLHYAVVDPGRLNAAKRLDRVVAHSRTLRGLIQERTSAAPPAPAAATTPQVTAARPTAPPPAEPQAAPLCEILSRATWQGRIAQPGARISVFTAQISFDADCNGRVTYPEFPCETRLLYLPESSAAPQHARFREMVVGGRGCVNGYITLTASGREVSFGWSSSLNGATRANGIVSRTRN